MYALVKFETVNEFPSEESGRLWKSKKKQNKSTQSFRGMENSFNEAAFPVDINRALVLSLKINPSMHE